jgi:allantoate deiminase
MAGHAGTVPMARRRDALAAAAEMIFAVERLGGTRANLVASVGRLEAKPGVPSVIPGSVQFTLDLRSPSDGVRRGAQAELLALLAAIAARRGIELASEGHQEVPAVALDARITAAARAAIEACGLKVRELSSGAGHTP